MKHVVLVGLPGVGKTTVGRAVARRLRRSFIDLDARIERSFGKSVTTIFGEHGEAVFRTAEAEVSADVARMPPSIIAPGGGWVLNPAATVHLHETSRIIYLRVAPDAAIRRMGRGIERRPLLKGTNNPYEAMRAIYEARRQVYEECSDMTVETGGVGRSKVIAKVVELVMTAERELTDKGATEND